MKQAVFVLLCLSLAGCAGSGHPTVAPTGPPMPRVRVLTYNTLHGLEPSGLTVKAGESTALRQARLDLQFQQIAAIQPDLLMLQEVNPLPDMAKAYVTALQERGVPYAEVHQVDACGIRLAPGLAVVPGLNNGLAILARAPLRLRKVKGLKLSGFGACGDSMGWQTGELRYALIAEVENPDTGQKVLAVSLHLHSDIERSAYFIRQIDEAVDQGRARREDIDSVVKAIEEGLERRLAEIRVLVKEIKKRQAEGTYLGVIVGGDFNFEPDDPEYQELEKAGLRDAHTMASRDSEDLSLDPQGNVLARPAERDVPSSLREAIKRLPDSQQRKILQGYQTGISQARRVDFVFLMNEPSNGPKGCLRQELFGRPMSASGPSGSDHYGVLVTYLADPSQC
jgi:endonuclease/exonuclease/phosphatase family metal-dependent hydrolase